MTETRPARPGRRAFAWSDDHFKTAIAALVALTTVAGAVLGWTAARVGDAAGGADAAGLDAVLRAGAARTFQTARLYQHYAAYTDFVRYRDLGNLADDALMYDYGALGDPAVDAIVRELAVRREEAYDQAAASQLFFVPRYLDPGGGYDRERELAETAAEAARRQDLDPDPHFARADRLREQSNRLVGTLVVLAGALWFYAVASGMKRRSRYILAAAGLACTLAGIVMGGMFA